MTPRVPGRSVVAPIVLMAGLGWLTQACGGEADTAGAPPAAASQTIEHDGVLVDVPGSWERTDTSECEFEIVRWSDPAVSPCEFEDGVAFYGSALFDPAHGPGVVRTEHDGEVTWSGYAYAGDYAVYVFENDDRDLVRDILRSARAPE